MFKYVYQLKGEAKLKHVLESQKKPQALNLAEEKKSDDWHRADIIAALHKQGWSIAALARVHELGVSTVRSALDKPYPKSEKIIAEAIGVAPEVIWPKRFADRNFTPTLRSC